MALAGGGLLAISHGRWHVTRRRLAPRLARNERGERGTGMHTELVKISPEQSQRASLWGQRPSPPISYNVTFARPSRWP
jgi:hypothetical protein